MIFGCVPCDRIVSALGTYRAADFVTRATNLYHANACRAVTFDRLERFPQALHRRCAVFDTAALAAFDRQLSVEKTMRAIVLLDLAVDRVFRSSRESLQQARVWSSERDGKRARGRCTDFCRADSGLAHRVIAYLLH